MKFCRCGHSERDHKGNVCCGDACYVCGCQEFELLDECDCRGEK